MFATHHRRFNTFILVAFLYQMNVCPCGHLEHNGWYQLFKSSLAESKPQHSDIGSTVDAEDSHDCDEIASAYLLDQRVNLDSLRDGLVFALANNPDDAGLRTGDLTSSALQSDASKTILALEMRAQLQVFLI